MKDIVYNKRDRIYHIYFRPLPDVRQYWGCEKDEDYAYTEQQYVQWYWDKYQELPEKRSEK